MRYWDWIEQEAKKINSDGCSFVTEIHEPCCFEHDLGYYYGRDPREAFKGGWEFATRVSRSEVDKRFRECNEQMDPLKVGSPMAWWRWLGVRAGGWSKWCEYRKVRP